MDDHPGGRPVADGEAGVRIGTVLWRVTILQVVLLTFIAVVVVSAVVGYRSLVARAERSAQLGDRVDEVLTGVLNAETGLRGYGLVGEREYLDVYDDAFPDLDHQLRELGDGGYGRQAAEIRRLIWDWRTTFADPIVTAVAGGRREDAAARFQTGEGKVRIDEIRRRTAELAADIADEGSERDGQAELVGLVAIVTASLAPLAAVGVGVALRRRLSREVEAPIAGLAAAAGRFGEGDLSARADPAAVRELDQVARAFNEMAAAMEQTVTELRSVDRMKSEFVSVVSHELRTPLTSIRGSLGLLVGGAFGDLPANADVMLAIAVSNTDRLIRLINDILDLERIAAGLEVLDLAPSDVASLLDEAAEGIRGVAEAAGVELVVRPVEGEVPVDRDRIVQCLTNLLGNAVKFSEAGGAVTLGAERRDGEVALSVSGGGRGIPADKLDDIFERFAQVDSSDARDKGGTGLGLAIVKGIIDQHGGRVEVASEPGVRTTFTLVLPAPVVPTVPVEPSDRADRPLVLVVEDDADLVQVLRTSLARHGIEVAVAAGAAEAVASAAAIGPDLLVLDVALSEGDGYGVVRQLRSDDRLRSIPTVVFTVHDLDRAARERLRLGETVFVPKAADDGGHFVEQVLDLLARHPGRAGATARPGRLDAEGDGVEPSSA